MHGKAEVFVIVADSVLVDGQVRDQHWIEKGCLLPLHKRADTMTLLRNSAGEAKGVGKEE